MQAPSDPIAASDFDSPVGRARRGRTARPLGHGDLRLLLLALIEQQPRHGYELMRQIAQLFKGLYTPSAGTIYPALAQLEADGWVLTDQDHGRKRYQITEAGRATPVRTAMHWTPPWHARTGARAT